MRSICDKINWSLLTIDEVYDLLQKSKEELEIRQLQLMAKEQQRIEDEKASEEKREKYHPLLRTIRKIANKVCKENESIINIFVNNTKAGKTVKIQFPYEKNVNSKEMLNEIQKDVESQLLDKIAYKIEMKESLRYGFGALNTLYIKM